MWQVCPIKPAFLFSNVDTGANGLDGKATAPKRPANDNGDGKDEHDNATDDDCGKPDAKRSKVEKSEETKEEKKVWEEGKKRGQNKHRKKARLNDGVCSWVLRGEKCTFGDRCKFSHDLEKCVKTHRRDATHQTSHHHHNDRWP